jgi:ubiquinone biosynthesis protein UbiJ
MAEPAVASDHLKVQETWKEVQAAQEKVAELYARWEELESKRSAL